MEPALGVICVALYFMGFAYAGFLNPNVLDLAPSYAGTLFGITNTFANIAGFAAPQMAGFYIQDAENTILGWRNVWNTTSYVVFAG